MTFNHSLRFCHRSLGDDGFCLVSNGVFAALAGDDGSYFDVWHSLNFLENVKLIHGGNGSPNSERDVSRRWM